MPSKTTTSCLIVSAEIQCVLSTILDGNCRYFSCFANFFLTRSIRRAFVCKSACESDATNAIEAALTQLDEFVSATKWCVHVGSTGVVNNGGGGGGGVGGEATAENEEIHKGNDTSCTDGNYYNHRVTGI